jgi:hypothetical protein
LQTHLELFALGGVGTATTSKSDGLFYFMNRDFKGVWIPKDVWLDHNLTWMEKLLLVEIDSLDAEKGCFASNGYFGEFFNLSNSRISEMITSLVSKGYITTFLLYEGKQVKQRILTPTIPIRKIDGGIRNTEEGYSEKAKGNNTLINNTINNKLINISFDEWWTLYDKKVGSKILLSKKWERLTNEEREMAINHTKEYKKYNPDKQFRKNPESYLNQKSFNDEIIKPVEPINTTNTKIKLK